VTGNSLLCPSAIAALFNFIIGTGCELNAEAFWNKEDRKSLREGGII
jgi:hypothetical protein